MADSSSGNNNHKNQRRFMNFLSLSRISDRAFISVTERAHWDVAEKKEEIPETPVPEPPIPQPSSHLTPLQQLHEQQAMLFRQHKEARMTPSSSTETPQSEQVSSSEKPLPSSSVTTDIRPVLISVDKSSFRSMLAITKRAASPFWMQLHSSIVTSGIIFEVADFRVNMGLWKQVQPSAKNRGVIVEIEYHGFSSSISDYGDEDMLKDDCAFGESLIREFWNQLAIFGAREFTNKRDENDDGEKRSVAEADAAGLCLARLYIDALSAGNQ